MWVGGQRKVVEKPSGEKPAEKIPCREKSWEKIPAGKSPAGKRPSTLQTLAWRAGAWELFSDIWIISLVLSHFKTYITVYHHNFTAVCRVKKHVYQMGLIYTSLFTTTTSQLCAMWRSMSTWWDWYIHHCLPPQLHSFVPCEEACLLDEIDIYITVYHHNFTAVCHLKKHVYLIGLLYTSFFTSHLTHTSLFTTTPSQLCAMWRSMPTW